MFSQASCKNSVHMGGRGIGFGESSWVELCLEGCQKFCPQGLGVCIQGGVCIGGLPVGGWGSVCGSVGGSA